MSRPMYLVMCTALMMTPYVLPRSERRKYAVLPVVLGAIGLMVGVFGDLAASGRARFTPSRELSEAVADPGNNFESTLALD